MSKRVLVVIISVIVLTGAGVLIWQVQNQHARAARLESEILRGLTEEELQLVIKSEAAADPNRIAGIVQSAEKRQAFLGGLREYLALAAQARRDGLVDDPKFVSNTAYKKNLLLADLYKVELNKGQTKSYVVPDEEVEAFWTDPVNEKQFNKDLEVMRAIQTGVAKARGTELAVPKIEGDRLTKIRKEWARAKILSDKAKNDAGFMQRPEIALRLKILETGILANDYLAANWAEKIKPTDQEVADYLASHPEFDVAKKRETANLVLQRARAGEDFFKLAEEFTENRPLRETGGLFENLNKGDMTEEIETVALNLENGQVADQIIETEHGFNIIKLESKQIKKGKNGQDEVKYSIRQILLQNRFEQPRSGNLNITPPFMTAEEIAKAEIEKEKHGRFIQEVVQRNPISLPNDFNVELPKAESLQKAPNSN